MEYFSWKTCSPLNQNEIIQVLIAPAQCLYLTFKPHHSKTSEFKHTKNEMPGKEQVEQLVNSELGPFLSNKRGMSRQKPHFSLALYNTDIILYYPIFSQLRSVEGAWVAFAVFLHAFLRQQAWNQCHGFPSGPRFWDCSSHLIPARRAHPGKPGGVFTRGMSQDLALLNLDMYHLGDDGIHMECVL